MSTNAAEDDVPVGRADRILAFMSFGLVILSIGCFFAVMISTAVGLKHADYLTGVWPVVTFVPWIGLPLAFVLLITLIIINTRRRRNA